MKKIKHQIWEEFRHPKFLASLNVNVNEEKYIRLFLKQGTIDVINDILKTDKDQRVFSDKYQKRKKIHA